MNIQVKNNGEIVFEGNSGIWLSDNQFDEEVQEMVNECSQRGYSAKHFFSGFWQCIMI